MRQDQPHPDAGRLAGWSLITGPLSEGVDRHAVFAAVCDSGVTTGRYVMMSVLAAGIATLGLLLSSPAVVIGAMLLSPLMGPIILLGFSFWTIDWTAARRAVLSLAVGLGLSLGVALALTWLSPLKEPTAEILARSRPNLFDLLVAAFSGLAGGYAVIRQRGETVIGVAIATALMPPIATVGFGIGTANWTIAGGALLLFATNLVAIALAAAGMAALYGFRPHLAKHGWVGQGLVIVLLAALCVPLTVSLNTIAVESRATAATRAMVRDVFGPKAKLSSLTVRSTGRALRVDGLVATPAYVAGAPAHIAERLQAAFSQPAEVSLDQVVLADPARLENKAPSETKTEAVAQIEALTAAVPFPARAVAFDARLQKGVVLLGPESGLDLKGAQALERGLRLQKGLERTEVVPPVGPLPRVEIVLAKDAPPAFGPDLTLGAWALARWGSAGARATVCGLTERQLRRLDIATPLRKALAPAPVEASAGGAPLCSAGDRRAPFLTLAPR